MQKSTFAFSLLFLGLIRLNAQSLSPQVISAAGGYSSTTAFSVSYTFGEMSLIRTATGSSIILTQGFEQPNDILTGLLELSAESEGAVALYPNPVSDHLYVGYEFPTEGKVTAEIFNTVGQSVNLQISDDYSSGKSIQQLNCSYLEAGMYFVQLHFMNSSGSTYSIRKKFEVIR